MGCFVVVSDGCIGGSGRFFGVEGLYCGPKYVRFFFVVLVGFQVLFPFLFFMLLNEVGDVLVEFG